MNTFTKSPDRDRHRGRLPTGRAPFGEPRRPGHSPHAEERPPRRSLTRDGAAVAVRATGRARYSPVSVTPLGRINDNLATSRGSL